MAMPLQLARARRPKRSAPRPLVEILPHININDLRVPKNLSVVTAPWISLRYPFISGARLSARVVEFAHSGRIQSFPLKWIKTGLGLPRFAFICQCGRPVISLYLHYANLGCRRCQNALYASQVCGKHSRPILQAKRLRTFLELKTGTGMSRRNRQRVQARLTTAKPSELASKRIDDRTKLPQSNYSTRGAMHWR
jgi:hypothetical protein